MKTAIVTLIAIMAMACGQHQNTDAMQTQDTHKADTSQSAPLFTPVMVDNTKDPVCGMPVKAGIGDTAHYNGKKYGFCSAECKAEFAAKKQQYAATAKMKNP